MQAADLLYNALAVVGLMHLQCNVIQILRYVCNHFSSAITGLSLASLLVCEDLDSEEVVAA